MSLAEIGRLRSLLWTSIAPFMGAIWTTFLAHRHDGGCLGANNKRGAHSSLCAPLPLGLPVQIAVPVIHGSVFYHVVQVAADDVVGCVITGTVSSDTAVVGAVVSAAGSAVVGSAGSAVSGAAVCAAAGAGAAVSAAGGQGEHHHKRQREQAKSLHSHFSLPVFRRQKRGSVGAPTSASLRAALAAEIVCGKGRRFSLAKSAENFSLLHFTLINVRKPFHLSKCSDMRLIGALVTA